MINSLPSDRIIEIFCSLSGEDDNTAFAPLCSAAADTLLLRVKPTASRSRFEQPLCYAAACLAFYRYTLVQSTDSVFDCKAGDISVKADPAAVRESARELLRDALSAIDGCLKSCFSFRIV